MKALLFCFLLFAASQTVAEERVEELSLTTGVGELVLKATPCSVENKFGFLNEAYATEGKDVHAGCWFKDHDIVNIWFYEETPALVATYRDYYFLPRKAH